MWDAFLNSYHGKDGFHTWLDSIGVPTSRLPNFTVTEFQLRPPEAVEEALPRTPERILIGYPNRGANEAQETEENRRDRCDSGEKEYSS